MTPNSTKPTCDATQKPRRPPILQGFVMPGFAGHYYMWPEEYALLGKYVDLTEGDYLEIGSMCGIIAMSFAEKHPSRTFVCVDNFSEGQDTIAGEKQVFLQNLREHNLQHVVLVEGDSLQVVPTLNRTFEVAFIDGNHAYEYVLNDALNSHRWVKPGGFLVFHDYEQVDSTTRAVFDFMKQTGAQLVETVSSVAVVQKPFSNAADPELTGAAVRHVAQQLESTRQEQPTHHKVFSNFTCWRGWAEAGRHVNFLGVKTRTSYFRMFKPEPVDRYEDNIPYPSFDEQYFEWIDLLEAVTTAQGHFTLIELGTGWGCWLANGFAALKQANPLPYTLIGVEAEPTHFQWTRQHLEDNGVDLSRCQLIEAAVTDKDGTVGFYTGQTQWGGPYECYGQAIGGPTPVKAISLNTILQPLTKVDLIDMDVQGAELDVLSAAADELNRKVKRIHIETHNREVEEGLRQLFGDLGWTKVFDYPCSLDYPNHVYHETDWGVIPFHGGVQTWLNLNLANPELAQAHGEIRQLRAQIKQVQSEVAALQQQLAAKEEEVQTLRAQKDELASTLRAVEESVGWQWVTRWRRMRDRLAPEGTWRRSLYDRLLSPWRRRE